MTVKGDGRARKTAGAEINRPQTVTVDMTGVVKLHISWEGGCSSSDSLVVALADASLHS